MSKMAFPKQEWHDVDDLDFHPHNYKKHPLSQILLLAEDICRFGQRKPVVIQNKDGKITLVAGEGLSKAIYWIKHEAPDTLYDDYPWAHDWIKRNPDLVGLIWTTLVPEDWTDEEIIGYLVADNETSKGAEDDTLMLVDILEKQQKQGYSLESIGFRPGDYKDLLKSINQVTSLGVRDKESIKGSLDAYMFGSIRQIMLLYEQDVYIRILAMTTYVREKMGVETNSEVFEALITQSFEQFGGTEDMLTSAITSDNREAETSNSEG